MLWIDFWVTFTPQSQRLGSYEPNRLTQSLLSVECCGMRAHILAMSTFSQGPSRSVWTVEVLWGEYEGTSMRSYEAELEAKVFAKNRRKMVILGFQTSKFSPAAHVTAM